MMPPIILASTSPRRRELLGLLGLPFEVIGSGYDEAQIDPSALAPPEYVMRLASGKAAEVASRLDAATLVIGADTTVVLDGAYLNKPQDAAGARRMLRLLSGRTHEVYTGLCLLRGAKILTECAVTAVTFDTLTDHVIDAYVATGEPLDKAGAYGIQGKALSFIPGINGDYFNVVGLPLFLLGQMLTEFGVSLWPA